VSIVSISYRQQHKKGDYLWFETKVAYEVIENEVGICVLTSMDISQRKMMEIELSHQKEFIEQLFDTDPNLIYVRDGNRKMLYCNKAVSDLIGLQRDDFLNMPDNYFPAADNQIEEYFAMEEKVINTENELLIEEVIKDKNGLLHYFQTIKKPFRTSDGDMNLLNISTNINKIKYYQKESEKAMEAKNDFFSTISHEIRTPMNSILGLTELLIKRNPRKGQVELLETLNYSANNLLSLINDVLDLSKIEAGKIELEKINFDFYKFMDQVYRSHLPGASSKSLEFTIDIDEGIPAFLKSDPL